MIFYEDSSKAASWYLGFSLRQHVVSFQYLAQAEVEDSYWQQEIITITVANLNYSYGLLFHYIPAVMHMAYIKDYVRSVYAYFIKMNSILIWFYLLYIQYIYIVGKYKIYL